MTDGFEHHVDRMSVIDVPSLHQHEHRPVHSRGSGIIIISASDLQAKTFPPINWVVRRYLAEGLTILAGSPKLGKSWLMFDIAISVATGRFCLGDIQCEQGDVLYLALEDNERRLHSRMTKLLGARAEWPTRLGLVSMKWPAAAEGVKAIRSWLERAASPRLVVVDVLTKFRAPVMGNANAYQADYAALTGLQELASEFGVAIVCVHHTRKSNGAEVDPFEQVSGTMGISGAADTTIVLKRDAQGVTLYGRGCDVEEFEVAVVFDKFACRWNIEGDAAEVRRTDERTVILEALADNPEGMTPAQVSDVTGRRRNNTKQLLHKMAKAGEVEKDKKGKYYSPRTGFNPDNPDNPDDPDNPDNRDNRSDPDDQTES